MIQQTEFPVLITGAGSFIGRHMTQDLVRAGLNVFATYRTANGFLERLRASSGNLTLCRIDISQKDEFAALPSSIAAVVHIAGVSTEAGISLDSMLDANVAGTRNVQRYALDAGATKLIFASSMMVHGRIEVAVVDSRTPVISPGTYGASKLLGERILASTSDRLPVVALRLPGVLGFGAHRAWLPTVLNKLRQGQKVEIFNPDAQFNNAADVKHVSRFVLHLLLEHKWDGFSVLPIAADGMMSIREIVVRMRETLKSVSKISVINSTRPSFIISSELAREFGYCAAAIGTVIDDYLECSASG